MDRGDAARANLRGIYTAGPGLLVERSFSMGRAHPRLRWPHCVRVLVERVARRILSLRLRSAAPIFSRMSAFGGKADID